MTNLFAICRPDGELIVKRVSLTRAVQTKVRAMFVAQQAAFLHDISEEIEFDGSWKPDDDELLLMDLPAEAAPVTQTLADNPVAAPVIDAANFLEEGIKALFITTQAGGNQRILIQAFSAQQALARKFTLLLDGNSFKELEGPAFNLDTRLVAIIEDNKLKFKSFFNMRKIFNLFEFYQEATKPELETFCAHDSVHVPNVEAFCALADQGIRKLVHAVSKTEVLDAHDVETISARAANVGLAIQLQNGKMVFPADRKEIKKLLRFLDDGLYQAPLSENRYITNSKRPVT